MAQDEDRRWRERMRRDDDNRRYSQNDPRGEYRGGEGSGRGWSEGSAWRNRDRDEWSSGSYGSGSYGSGGYGGREGGMGGPERWGERSGSDWEQSGWRDMDRGEQGRPYGGRRHETSQRGMGGSLGGPMGGSWRRDSRQDRDYAGSMRAGESGSMGGERSSRYGGSRYGSGSYGGRSGMGYGGGSSGSSGPWGGREYDQYSGMTSERDYGSGSGYGASAAWDRGSREQGYGYGGPHDWGGQRGHGEDRGFWDKASDEVSSWFGDEDAERRREMDRRHSGRGPRNYARSDSRINEDVCDRLTDHPMVDASDIEVAVSGREVTLTGTVRSREEKRRAEDLAEAVSGVMHVQNNLRVQQHTGSSDTLGSFSHATEGAFGEQGGSTMSSRTTSSTGASGTGGSGSTSSTAGKTGSTGSSTSGAAETKTTTGTSPGVMRSDPSTSTTRGA